jgi:hypothetical protein
MLSRNIIIRKISIEERETFYNITKNSRFTFPELYSYLVEVTRYVKKGDLGRFPPHPFKEDEIDTRTLISSLITSFRLIQDGYVDYENIFSRCRSEILGFTATLQRQLIVNPYLHEYVFKIGLNKLRELQARVYRVDNHNSGLVNSNVALIKLVLDRFNYSYERGRISDTVIVLSIAFEILFSKGDDNDSITFKLKTRVSKLLGETQKDRRQIEKIIRDFYYLRSGLIHGRKQQSKKEDILIIQNSYNYLRRSIIQFLMKLLKKQSINNKFTHELFIESLDYG